MMIAGYDAPQPVCRRQSSARAGLCGHAPLWHGSMQLKYTCQAFATFPFSTFAVQGEVKDGADPEKGEASLHWMDYLGNAQQVRRVAVGLVLARQYYLILVL